MYFCMYCLIILFLHFMLQKHHCIIKHYITEITKYANNFIFKIVMKFLTPQVQWLYHITPNLHENCFHNFRYAYFTSHSDLLKYPVLSRKECFRNLVHCHG
jgi:hypothetical protein